jgi:mono/diheme cytochrome c family protein
MKASEASKRLLAVAIAATVFAAGFGAAVVYAAYTGNDIAAHKASSTITNAECIGCHGQKANEASLDPLTFSAHKRHLKSAYLRFQTMGDGCAACHASTDIEQGSGATVNKQVSAAVCASCHGVFRASAHGGKDWVKTDPRSCTKAGCHNAGGSNDPAAAHAAAGYVNTFFARSRAYCAKCHGGLAFYAGEETTGF